MAMDKTQMDPMISSLNINEYFNSITHLIGAILSIIGTIVLIVFSAHAEKWLHLVSFAVYGTTLFLSLLASCLLHFFLLHKKYIRALGILDHNAIYLLIAGSYTPFALVVLQGPLGWSLFALIWGLAVFNITIKSIFFQKMGKNLSTVGFILMGWPAIFYAIPLYHALGGMALALMVGGGLVYTIGAMAFMNEKPDPFPPFFGNHEIWHVAVLIGNAMFFTLMLLFVLPFGQ